MSERNAIHRVFDEFFRDAGYEKKSGSWYRRGEGVIAVSNLQKSQYGPRYYLNQGFWLCQLGDEHHPKPHKLHVQVRLEGLLPAAEERINELLDLNHEMSARSAPASYGHCSTDSFFLCSSGVRTVARPTDDARRRDVEARWYQGACAGVARNFEHVGF